jgi:AraC family transcriptional activator of pobA
MSSKQLFHFHTISEYHRAAGLPKPAHPLISLVHMDDVKRPGAEHAFSMIYDFYSIAMKRVGDAKFRYGQQASDFDEGVCRQVRFSELKLTRAAECIVRKGG